jgi:hypothetical protein
MTEVWTERALIQAMDLSLRAPADAGLVLSHADFEAAVRQGFKDLRRPDVMSAGHGSHLPATSFSLSGCLGRRAEAAGQGRAVLAGVKAGALRVACGQP